METPRPHIVHRCRRCGVTRADVDRNAVVVSSKGYAHIGVILTGMTKCGQRADGKGYWWPL